MLIKEEKIKSNLEELSKKELENFTFWLCKKVIEIQEEVKDVVLYSREKKSWYTVRMTAAYAQELCEEATEAMNGIERYCND